MSASHLTFTVSQLRAVARCCSRDDDRPALRCMAIASDGWAVTNGRVFARYRHPDADGPFEARGLVAFEALERAAAVAEVLDGDLLIPTLHGFPIEVRKDDDELAIIPHWPPALPDVYPSLDGVITNHPPKRTATVSISPLVAEQLFSLLSVFICRADMQLSGAEGLVHVTGGGFVAGFMPQRR